MRTWDNLQITLSIDCASLDKLKELRRRLNEWGYTTGEITEHESLITYDFYWTFDVHCLNKDIHEIRPLSREYQATIMRND